MVKRWAVLFLTLLAPAYGQQEGQGGGQQGQTETREEMERRRKEAIEDYTNSFKKYKAWTAKFTASYMNSSGINYTEGTVAVKVFDEKNRWLLWEEAVNKNTDPNAKPDLQVVSRTLYKSLDYQHTDEKAKVVEKYDFTTIDFFFAPMLTRDGVSKELEKVFTVECMSNAKYMKTPTERTDGEIKQMGFKSREEYEAWLKKIHAGDNGHKEQEEQVLKEQAKKKNMPQNPKEAAKAVKFYLFDLTPTTEVLKQDIRVIHLRTTPEFLPTSIIMEMTDGQICVQFTHHEIDPKTELEDSKFKIATDGFTVKHPQKGD